MTLADAIKCDGFRNPNKPGFCFSLGRTTPPRKLPFYGRLRERTEGDRFSLEEETWILGKRGGVKGCGERVPGKAPALEDPLAGRTSQESAVARGVIS